MDTHTYSDLSKEAPTLPDILTRPWNEGFPRSPLHRVDVLCSVGMAPVSPSTLVYIMYILKYIYVCHKMKYICLHLLYTHTLLH